MDTWLNNSDIEILIKQLNPELEKGRDYDNNWEMLKKEKQPLFDLSRCVKASTPTLFVFENHFSFSYRRFDGAHWHTELRAVDIEQRSNGLTSEQRLLKDAVDTLLALTNSDFKLKWITPINQNTNQFDPRYQLIKMNDEWLCVINGKAYLESSNRVRQGRNHAEITFSTREKPVFDLNTINDKLDQLFGNKNAY